MSEDRLAVAEHADLASRGDLSRREVGTLVAMLNEDGGCYLMLEEWLVEEKPIEPMDGWARLFCVDELSDETEKAWQVRVGGEECWVPKSQSEIVQLADDVDAVESPSKTLTDFAAGAAGSEGREER